VDKTPEQDKFRKIEPQWGYHIKKDTKFGDLHHAIFVIKQDFS
jgi:hypothetical protein